VNLIKRNVRKSRDVLDEQRRTRDACNDHARSLCEQVDLGAACYEQVSDSCLSTFENTDADTSVKFDMYLVHVSFEEMQDKARRERFQAIPTTLELPQEEIDLLIELAPELLHEDAEFQSLLKDLDAHIDSGSANE